MYIPQSFQVEDRNVLLKLIQQNSFATLVTTLHGELFASHIPVIKHPTRDVLEAHIAVQNPQCASLDQGGLLIFNGPHAYISPTLYTISPAVPTWNYTAVHVSGQLKILVGENEIIDFMNRLVDEFEAGRNPRWTGLEPDFFEKMIRGVVCFEMAIEQIEGKFKLSQNRNEADQKSVYQVLECGLPHEQEVAVWMRKLGIGTEGDS